MKCQKCEKPATFHITELTDEDSFEELHLCEDHARNYLTQTEEEEAPATLASMLATHLKVGQTAEDLARLDRQSCPICGITFYEFRQAGRLGCPHDYVCFEEELQPLIVNIHGDLEHTGKKPQRGGAGTDRQTELIRLRRDMQEAVNNERYEEASRIRDEIRSIEQLEEQQGTSDTPSEEEEG